MLHVCNFAKGVYPTLYICVSIFANRQKLTVEKNLGLSTLQITIRCCYRAEGLFGFHLLFVLRPAYEKTLILFSYGLFLVVVLKAKNKKIEFLKKKLDNLLAL